MNQTPSPFPSKCQFCCRQTSTCTIWITHYPILSNMEVTENLLCQCLLILFYQGTHRALSMRSWWPVEFSTRWNFWRPITGPRHITTRNLLQSVITCVQLVIQVPSRQRHPRRVFLVWDPVSRVNLANYGYSSHYSDCLCFDPPLQPKIPPLP